MAKFAGSPDFFSNLQSGLDTFKTGMDQSRNYDSRSFGNLIDGLDKMKRAKDSAPKTPAKSTAKTPVPKTPAKSTAKTPVAKKPVPKKK